MNQLSCNIGEHYTPEWLTNAISKGMGGIDLDPCSCDLAQKVVNAKTFFSLENGKDGLVESWNSYKNIFINPEGSPGGKIVKAFWKKAVLEYLSRKNVSIIFLHFSLEQICSLGKLKILNDKVFNPLEFNCHFPVKRIAYDTIGIEGFNKSLIQLTKEWFVANGITPSKKELKKEFEKRYKQAKFEDKLIRVPGKSPTHASFISILTRNEDLLFDVRYELVKACKEIHGFGGKTIHSSKQYGIIS